MPIRRKTYSFKAKANITPRRTDSAAREDSQPQPGQSNPTALQQLANNQSSGNAKRKSRAKSFILRRPDFLEDREQLGLRSSVRLRSFRKRKMADREEAADNKSEPQVKSQKVSTMGQEDIQRKIGDQIRMRDGVMKLMSACSNFKQTIEASKNYLTINARVLALMSALQKKKSDLVLMEYNKQNSQENATNTKPCSGRVMISDIRIPLMWKDGAHYKGKTGGEQLYFMFCLLKLGNQVYDTSLKQVDVTCTDVNFEEVVTFEDMDPDFKLHFEIYYTVIANPDYHLVAPIRTPRKGATFSAPNYCLAGHTQFCVNDIKGSTGTFDVAMGGKGASATTALGQADELPDNELDLWGQICCCLSAQPSCMTSDRLTGTISLQDTSTGQPQWVEHHCVVRHCSIKGWKTPYDADGDRPCDCSIKIKPTMSISQTHLPGLQKDHVLIITSTAEENEPVLSFASQNDMEKWKRMLNQEIVNASAWKSACETFMEPKRVVKSFNINTSLRLYDQIKLNDIDDTVRSAPASPKVVVAAEARNGCDSPPPVSNGDGNQSTPERKASADDALVDGKEETLPQEVDEADGPAVAAAAAAGTLETKVDDIEPPKEIVKVQTDV